MSTDWICDCQRNLPIRTSRKLVPLCHTSCSKLSSNISHSPSFQLLVSLATRMNVFSGTFNPKWHLRRQFVGPQCGQTWVFGWSKLNLTCPLLQLAAGVKLSIILQVIGASLQFFDLTPRANSSNCFQSPISLRFSDSSTKPSLDKSFKPSSLIICQYFWISTRSSLYVVCTLVQNGVDFSRLTL